MLDSIQMASIDLPVDVVAAVDSAGAMALNSARMEVVSRDAETAADSDGGPTLDSDRAAVFDSDRIVVVNSPRVESRR